MNVIGDPSACKEIIERFEGAGVDELILVMQTGTVPHELVMESIKTFDEQVIPHFSADERPTSQASTATTAA